LPDFYHGEKWPAEKPLNEETMPQLLGWLKNFPWEDRLKKDFEKLLKHMQDKQISEYGLIGFCWGAWFIFKASSLDESFRPTLKCGVDCHPSLGLDGLFGGNEATLAKAVRVPQLIFPAGNDPANVKEGGEVIEILRNSPLIAGPEQNRVGVFVYPEMTHGFMTRGDVSKPEVARDVKDALQKIIPFYQRYLGTPAQDGSQPAFPQRRKDTPAPWAKV